MSENLEMFGQKIMPSKSGNVGVRKNMPSKIKHLSMTEDLKMFGQKDNIKLELKFVHG